MGTKFRITIEEIGANNSEEFELSLAELRGVQRHIQTKTLMEFSEESVRPMHRLGFYAGMVFDKFNQARAK